MQLKDDMSLVILIACAVMLAPFVVYGLGVLAGRAHRRWRDR